MRTQTTGPFKAKTYTVKNIQGTSRQRGEVTRDENMKLRIGDKVTLCSKNRKEPFTQYIVTSIPGLNRFILVSDYGSVWHVPSQAKCKPYNAFGIPLAVLLGRGFTLKQTKFKTLDKTEHVEFEVKSTSLDIEAIKVLHQIW